MSEGLFTLEQCKGWIPTTILNGTSNICRVYPNRILEFVIVDEGVRLFESTVSEEGLETLKIGITQIELESTNNLDLELQIFKFEAIRHFRSGGTFPAKIEIEGSASGFFAYKQNCFFTSLHVVSGVVDLARKRNLISGKDHLDCKGLRIESHNGRLITDSPKLTHWPTPSQYQSGFDFAVFEVQNDTFFDIGKYQLDRETVFMGGYPMRTKRPEDQLQLLGYQNANYDLRFSSGHTLKLEETNIIADCDGGPGNSGSPLLDKSGNVLGVYCGSYGSGLSSWNGVLRSFVPMKDIINIL